MIRSPSLTVGTSPLGLRLRYSGSRLPPNGPPISRRSNGMSSSAQHHNTFCTLDELARPQIFSIDRSSPLGQSPLEPQFRGERNRYNGTVRCIMGASLDPRLSQGNPM